MKLTPEMLTGKSCEHLINLPTPHSPNHFLQAEAMKAFQGLQQSAVKNGFNWGTEIDIFDPDLLPQGQSLQLEPWEYEKGGYFFELSEFLTENLPHFDFALPFISQPEGKKIGREPWHISYLPLAEQASRLFTPDVQLQVWQHEIVAGKETLIEHLPEIFEQYVV